MEIARDFYNEVVVLQLKGNILSSADANIVHQIVHEELEHDHKKFILDMAEVSLINSSGVGILIGALTAAKNQDGDVKLASVSQKVSHIFKMMHLDQVFMMFDSIEEAEKSFLF